MEGEYSFDNIDKPTFDQVLQRYSDPLPASPDDGGESLDDQRYTIIPAAIKTRAKDPHLTKDELITLVAWKLKHGTFRPSLKALAESNTAAIVESTSREAFSQYNTSSPDSAAKTSLQTLTRLRGIGPATASLILSAHDPERAPFFSDELFRWAMGTGWDRRIRYNAKEYADLCARVAELVARTEGRVSAVQAEKVAYVLGHGGEGGSEAVKAPGGNERDGMAAAKGGRKRQARDDCSAAAGLKQGDAQNNAGDDSTGRPKRKQTKRAV